MITVAGEILFDIFPEYRMPGGAPFNFACHMKNLGFPVQFISRIGSDAEGREIIKYLDEIEFDSSFIQRDNNHPTGKVYIHRNTKGDLHYEIPEKSAYDYIISDNINLSKTRLIYFGTLIQRSKKGKNLIKQIISRKKTKARSFCDLNLRKGCCSRDTVEQSLKYADILKLNQDELIYVSTVLECKNSFSDTVRFLMKKFSIQLVAVTRGEYGSIVYSPNKEYSVMPEMNKNIVDTVGAGDAYSAILAAGYLNKWSLKDTIRKATDFASVICSTRGAIPEDRDIYKEYLSL